MQVELLVLQWRFYQIIFFSLAKIWFDFLWYLLLHPLRCLQKWFNLLRTSFFGEDTGPLTWLEIKWCYGKIHSWMLECFVSSCHWSSCSLSLSFELFIDQEKHCYFDSTCNSRDQMLDGELETVTCRWFQDLLRLDLRGLLSKRFSLATSLKIAREGQM